MKDFVDVMGNCCDRCFGRLDKRKYLRTRYNVERDFSIEFENLMDEEMQQEEVPNVVKTSERTMLLGKQYDKLVLEQKRIDVQIDQELVRQEEELREEEEAYYEAKREAARVAKMQRKKEMAIKSNSLVVKEGKNAWLGDENEWELAGGEDDFEMFLESVKARSLAARTRAIASQVPGIDEQSESSVCRSDRSQTEESIDLEWEHEAGMQPFTKEKQKEHEDYLAELGIKPTMLRQGDARQGPAHRGAADLEWDNQINTDEKETLLGKGRSTDDEADR